MKTYTLETEVEDDGRWIAEILELPGVIALRIRTAMGLTPTQTPPCSLARRSTSTAPMNADMLTTL